MYQVNPGRGCGEKVYDGFYLEGLGGPLGTLHMLTWVLGNGLREGENLVFKAPPRTTSFFQPWATIACQELILADMSWQPLTKEELCLYKKVSISTKNLGGLDHVGESGYKTPLHFTKELEELGPSRRIDRGTAEAFARLIYLHGAIPLFFTHKQIPLFRDEFERDMAVEYAARLFDWFDPEDAQYHWTPCWRMDNWGMYCSRTRDQYNGRHHFMVVVLKLIYHLRELHKSSQSPLHKEAIKFFGTLDYAEQIFAASWVTRVGYTLPKDGKLSDDTIRNIPGLSVLDLNLGEERKWFEI